MTTAIDENAEARVYRLQVELGDDTAAITKALLSELGLNALQAEVLEPWVRDRVHHLLRQWAMRDFLRERSEAGRAHANGKVTVHSQAGPSPDITGPLAFLDFPVLMAGAPAGFKLYRYLTVAEHSSRLAMHQRHADAALRSAASHEWAVKELHKHKAGCLDDIAPETLMKELPKDSIRP